MHERWVKQLLNHLPKKHWNPVFHTLATNWVKKLLKKGDFIKKELAGKFKRLAFTLSKPSTPSIRPREETIDMTINRLTSGSGIKRRRKIVKPNHINGF